MTLGVIEYPEGQRSTDYLYRVSIKCLVTDPDGQVLVVKETGRDWWDLPGGGMDYGEDIKSAITREMKEEVNLSGDFLYEIIDVDDPAYLKAHDFWQVRLVYKITPTNYSFSVGVDSDEVAFVSPEIFQNSHFRVEQRIYKYATI